MIDISRIENKCYGCCACQNICTCGAIRMESNEFGFLMPKIDLDCCVNCGRCDMVCPIDKAFENSGETEVYAVVHTNREVLLNSSSGGAFTAISEWVLSQKGVIVGAMLDTATNTVNHVIADTSNMRDNLRGSKYVQSNIGDIYQKIFKILKEHRWVLFVGTACQVHGLYNYLGGRKYEKLVTCDILCHGVASPMILKNSLDFIQDKYNTSILSVDFRNKKEGWSTPHPIVCTKNGKYTFDFYMKMYYKDLFLRECCYQCPYASKKRVSDFTIGDFWGIEKTNLTINHECGCSMVFVNTTLGKQIMNQIKKDLIIEKSQLSDCNQVNLYHPTEKPCSREEFWSDYFNLRFSDVLAKYGEFGIKGKLRVLMRKCKNKLGEITKKNG